MVGVGHEEDHVVEAVRVVIPDAEDGVAATGDVVAAHRAVHGGVGAVGDQAAPERAEEHQRPAVGVEGRRRGEIVDAVGVHVADPRHRQPEELVQAPAEDADFGGREILAPRRPADDVHRAAPLLVHLAHGGAHDDVRKPVSGDVSGRVHVDAGVVQVLLPHEGGSRRGERRLARQGPAEHVDLAVTLPARPVGKAEGGDEHLVGPVPVGVADVLQVVAGVVVLLSAGQDRGGVPHAPVGGEGPGQEVDLARAGVVGVGGGGDEVGLPVAVEVPAGRHPPPRPLVRPPGWAGPGLRASPGRSRIRADPTATTPRSRSRRCTRDAARPPRRWRAPWRSC